MCRELQALHGTSIPTSTTIKGEIGDAKLLEEVHRFINHYWMVEIVLMRTTGAHLEVRAVESA
nr:hypothetical protein Iba_chr05bCG3700 [Ipomoea batatas]GMC95324.1 hypothetical protein Iba_chr05cCG7460 [Ipomoea batatas]